MEGPLCLHFYLQPYAGELAQRPSMPVDGPIFERDPTFATLRARYPDPSPLLDLSIRELRDELLVWGDARIGDRDLFGNWSGANALPGYRVGLVSFALDMGWLIEDAIRNGHTDYDPSEGRAVLSVKHLGDRLGIYSEDIGERFEVSLAAAWNAVYGLNGRVRAFLLAWDRCFMNHPELGSWVRGETVTVR